MIEITVRIEAKGGGAVSVETRSRGVGGADEVAIASVVCRAVSVAARACGECSEPGGGPTETIREVPRG